MKVLNFDLQTMGEKWLLQLNAMDEFCNNAYENSRIYREKTKMWHDKHISRHNFMANKKFYIILVFDYFLVNYIQDGRDCSKQHKSILMEQ